MIDLKITCDRCGKDLITTSNSIDYRIRVSAEMMKSYNSVVTSMQHSNPLPDDLHFCGFRCLREWVVNGIAGE